MTYDELIRSIESAAEEKNREVIENAKHEAEEIVNNARIEADFIKQQHLAIARKTLQVEQNRQTFLTREENKGRVNEILRNLFEETLQTVKVDIKDYREDPGYEARFSFYLSGILESLSDEETVLHIDPRDEALCKKFLPELNRNCTVLTDISSFGGLNGSSRDGAINVFNTLESRLENARELFRMEIYSILKGV